MIILVDQDNVLADFDGEVTRIWRERYPDRFYVPTEERKSFYTKDDYPEEMHSDLEVIYTAPGFLSNLPLIAGAADAVSEMRRLGHEVFICTSPLSQYENCVKEKFEWVENNLGRAWTKRIILGGDKTLVRADCLIDAKPEVTGLMNPFWEHLLFDQPWNRSVNEKTRISWRNWKEVMGFQSP